MNEINLRSYYQKGTYDSMFERALGTDFTFIITNDGNGKIDLRSISVLELFCEQN